MRNYDCNCALFFYTMTKKKTKRWKNLIFIAVVALIIIPQTRKPIQVALNKIVVAVIKPSAFAKADQTQLPPFDYEVVSVDGIQRKAAVGQGRVTLISYWATWCPPCIAELPSIAALYADYGNKVDFLLITNEDSEVVTKFLRKKAINIPAVHPGMDTPEALFERSIPTNYVIDKKGNIVIKKQGPADWNSAEVRETLDALIAE